MGEILKKERNETIDIIRAFAILLVVLGHTISGLTIDYSTCLFFKVIWTLQMPLFFIISGFLNKYARPATDIKTLFLKLGKKTLAYMIPFLIWTFVIRGLIFGQTDFFNISNFIYNLDTGYWFLFVLWIIVVFFELVMFITSKFNKKNNIFIKIILPVLFMAFVTVGLFILGHFIGYNFLSIKLICYYIPFYCLGYIWGQLKDSIEKIKNNEIIISIVAFISALVWLALMMRFDFFNGVDNLTGTVLRYLCSGLGCITFCFVISKACELAAEKVKSKLCWIGSHTLEIYVMHSLLLCLAPCATAFPFASIEGVGIVMLNYVLTLILVIGIALIIDKIKVFRKVLFWK